MSFLGTEFVFDGISSYEFGLSLYERIDNTSQSATSFASNVEFSESRPYRKYASFCHGGGLEDSLEFTLVFGVTEERKAQQGAYDRWEMQRIASWLTGHKEYKWLQIQDDGLTEVRYLCYIHDLEAIEIGGSHWGFQCDVTCDSPFAYMLPETYHYDLNGSQDILFRNRSSYNGYYRPQMQVSLTQGGDLTIVNHSDGDRVFELKDVPVAAGDIFIDHENQVIRCDADLNLYPYWNLKFLRLLRGDNKLTISGTGSVDIICSFPVNVGG